MSRILTLRKELAVSNAELYLSPPVLFRFGDIAKRNCHLTVINTSECFVINLLEKIRVISQNS